MNIRNNITIPGDAVQANVSDGIDPEKSYIFTPAGLDVKITLGVLTAASGVLGFLGNLAVLHFVHRKEKKRSRRDKRSNLNYFIRSLALSDVLGTLICIPILLINWFVDVFQTGWPCRIARFFVFVFPIITIYNLVVTALERYILICRATSRPLARVTVQKLVKGAWILAVFVSFLPSLTIKGIRVDLNATHYTVLCKQDKSSPVNTAIAQCSVFLTYILPFAFISFTCASVLRVVRRKKFQGAAFNNNVSSATRKQRLKQRNATLLLLAIILAFVVPYFLIMAYTVFETIAKPSKNFRRDFVIRSTGALLGYLNSVINFCIHLVQLPGFCSALKYIACICKATNNEVKRIGENEVINKKRHAATSRSCNDNSEERRTRSASMSNLYNTNTKQLTYERRHSY